MSVAVLADAVEHLELPLDRVALRDAVGVLDRLGARVAVAVGEYEAAGLHEVDGSLTMRAWLGNECGRDPRSATKLTAAGRRLRVLPVLAEAVLAGAISGGQLDVILANLPERHLGLFAEHEADIVPTLVDLGVERTRKAMDLWRQRADALADDREPRERENEVHFAKTIDGRGELRGSFDADGAALLDAALRVGDPGDRSLSLAERRACALEQMAQHFLDHQHKKAGGRHRPHVNVTLTYEQLVEGIGGTYTDTGQPVSPAGLGVLRCDSALHRLLVDGASGILDYGRATRQWPVDLYNAIMLRDGGCRFGTCDAPPSWCDVHHVDFWEHGGATSIDNGVAACRRHHRMTHKPGYHLKLLPDGTTEFTHPDGHVETSTPRGPAPQELWPTGTKRRRGAGS